MRFSGADLPSPDNAEWRQGWRVVVASALGYGCGNAMVLITAGLFIRPMRAELNWTTTAVTIAPIMSLVWALASPLSGTIISRFGPRKSALAGLGLLALALLSLAFMPAGPLTLYGLAAGIGLISILTNVPTYATGLSGWFSRHAGAAFGIAFNGSSLVGLVAVPLVSFAIASHGWRGGYVALAALVLLVGLPVVAFWFKEKQARPAGEGRSLGSLTRVLSIPMCWMMATTFFVGSIPLGGFMGHLQPMLAERGFPIVTATALGMLYSGAVCAGRIAGGVMLDRFWPFAVAAIMFGLASIGGVSLAYLKFGTALPAIVLTVALVGMGQGAEADFLAFFALRCFDKDLYPAAMGVNVTASCLGIAVGGFAFAALYDWLGQYRGPFLLGACCFAMAGMLLVGMGFAERRRHRTIKCRD